MPNIPEPEAFELLAAAPVARLATVGADGRPHLVPIVFALDGRRLVTAVDHKPKRTRSLKRLRNLASNPAVSVLADHYEDDWDRLWWVRADGTARVDDTPAAVEWAAGLLAARYPRYRTRPPAGPVIVAEIHRIIGWRAAGV